MKLNLAMLRKPRLAATSQVNCKLAPLAALGVLSLIFSSCVTVNVNFPESAVQKATDDYVKDLYRAKEKGKSSPTAPASAPSERPQTWLVLPNLLGDLIASAQAADVNFTVTSGKAMDILASQKGRIQEILAQKRAGLIGETKDGHVAVRGRNGVAGCITEGKVPGVGHHVEFRAR